MEALDIYYIFVMGDPESSQNKNKAGVKNICLLILPTMGKLCPYYCGCRAPMQYYMYVHTYIHMSINPHLYSTYLHWLTKARVIEAVYHRIGHRVGHGEDVECLADQRVKLHGRLFVHPLPADEITDDQSLSGRRNWTQIRHRVVANNKVMSLTVIAFAFS